MLVMSDVILKLAAVSANLLMQPLIANTARISDLIPSVFSCSLSLALLVFTGCVGT